MNLADLHFAKLTCSRWRVIRDHTTTDVLLYVKMCCGFPNAQFWSSMLTNPLELAPSLLKPGASEQGRKLVKLVVPLDEWDS